MTATLDIATVQAFLLVADLQNFTRTAEALGTTQAAVSLKLQRLETLLGKRSSSARRARSGSRQTARRSSIAPGR